MNAFELAQMIRGEYDVSDIGYIRLSVCYSAAGEGRSLAAWLSLQLREVEVKGHVGPVFCNFDPEAMSDLRESVSMESINWMNNYIGHIVVKDGVNYWAQTFKNGQLIKTSLRP